MFCMELKMMRKFSPLPKDHWLVGQTCPACSKVFQEGDETTLITLGPGDSPEEQEKARMGRAYNAVAISVHWDCAGGIK